MLVKPNGPLTLIGIRGATFISLSFLDQILSADFLSKLSKLFKVKFDINRVILTPYPAYWVFQKLLLGGAKYEHFSFLQSSCQLGLTSLSKQTTGSKSLLTKWKYCGRCFCALKHESISFQIPDNNANFHFKMTNMTSFQCKYIVPLIHLKEDRETQNLFAQPNKR